MDFLYGTIKNEGVVERIEKDRIIFKVLSGTKIPQDETKFLKSDEYFDHYQYTLRFEKEQNGTKRI